MAIVSQIKHAVVLNSRQALQPSGQLDWIRMSGEAVKWAQENGFGLVSSVGAPNWELIIALASIHRLSLKLVIPESDSDQIIQQIEWATAQFKLQPHLVKFMPGKPSEASQKQGRHQSGRDSLVLDEADLLIPVSIRPGGLLEELVDQHRQAGAEINDQFKVKYQPRSEPLAYSLEGLDINPALHQLKTDYVVHWTRASNAPWPDELLIDYYRDILSSLRYPRLAINSLNHIIEKGTIRASGRNLTADIRVVSFSSAKPHELIPLVKWRARRRVMSFEPYGIGFDPELAERIGIKPVVYYDKETGLSGSEVASIAPWQFQSQGRITDWREEKELRLPSDLQLNDLPKEKMILFCLMPDEATQLTASHGIKALSFLP